MFGKQKDNNAVEVVEKIEHPIHMDTLFVLHTAIECIRYGQKAAAYAKELPALTLEDVQRYAYSMIMMFDKNFKKSVSDGHGGWMEEGTGLYALPEQIYERLRLQADSALIYTNKVFKTAGVLTRENMQTILHFAENVSTADCPVTDYDEIRFSELEDGYKNYISFQTNVAINRLLKAFNGTKARILKKSNLSASLVDDIVALKIYEHGQAPVPPTPDTGEIMTFVTDDKAADVLDEQIEVDATDLDILISAQKNLGIWWHMFDLQTDKVNLIEIMAKEARNFVEQRQKNPPSAAFVMAE